MTKRSVAIVGFSPLTLPFLKSIQADEYWTMNHAFLVTGIDRIDRLFELHKRSWYLRGEQPKVRAYKRYLAKKQTYPIYMQAAEVKPKLVPSAVAYPLKEIMDDLFPNFKRFDMEGKLIDPTAYFTSTVSFMIAMAIYEKFDRIYLVGVDMDTDTEFGYQKPCGEFWIGMAMGRGIEVHVPTASNLLNAPIYGYDIVPYIDKEHVVEVMTMYQKTADHWLEQMRTAAGKLNEDPENEDNVSNYLQTSGWCYLYDGAVKGCVRMIEVKDGYISRQWLEMYRTEYMNGVEFYKGQVNKFKGHVSQVGRENVPDDTWKEYLNARASMYANFGAVQLINRLINIIDFRPVKMELSMNIVEEE